MSATKIMIVDDHEVVRVGLAALLERESGFEVVAEASSGQEAIEKADQYNLDIILMDICMSSGSGIKACRKICTNHSNVEVIMLTSHTDDEAIVKSIVAGASGYILKEIDSEELIEAIETVSKGGSLLDPKTTQKVLQHMRRAETEENKENKLTEREETILEFLSEGLTNREIAKKVHLAEKTVRNYVSRILKKLDMNNRVEAATYITKKKMRQQNNRLEI